MILKKLCNSIVLFKTFGETSDAYLCGYLTTGLENNEILFTDNVPNYP